MGAIALTAAASALFWVPAAAAARGYFPAPLDDVYIHFDFARSIGRGAPFEWIPGNGYSSGETSPLYAVVLAAGWLVGFRGRFLGVWAAIIAVLSVASYVRALQLLARPVPTAVSGAIALLALSIGILDWSLFSGMEVAVFAAALGQTLLALGRSRGRIDERGGLTREATQWRLGAWGAALCLLRPESGVLVAVFAAVAARGALRRSGLAAAFRVGFPGAVATATVLVVNRLATGEAQSAGAQLKLLSSNPYLSDVDRARAYVENVVTFVLKGLATELASVPVLGLVLPVLALAALVSRPRRAVAAGCLLGALGWTLLVSFNNNSQFHNFRYYTPALLLLLAAAASGAAAIARALGPKSGTALTSALVLAAALGSAARIPAQIAHYRRAAGNIRDQQIEVALRLGALMEPGTSVLLNDAGAIPYVLDRPALDALGLGGYRRMPFARAAVNGEASTVELIERLEPRERPRYFALYPNWFGQITARFGVEVERVTLQDNLICAGPTKVIYRAEWSALDVPHEQAPDIIDELDVADVISEAAHAYRSPVPNGGWTTLDVLGEPGGRRRFDAGRIIPAGGTESFVVKKTTNARQVRFVMRLDDRLIGSIRIHLANDDPELVVAPASAGAWREASATIDTPAVGAEITIEAVGGELRDYHVWLRTSDTSATSVR